MPPPTSKVWKFFKRCNDSKTVKWQLCEVKLTYTEGTTNMLNHIRLKYSVQDESAWWKDNSDKYSTLSVLARRYLAVPSTSVPSERIFSQQVWLLRSFATDCHRLASTKLFSLTKTLPQWPNNNHECDITWYVNNLYCVVNNKFIFLIFLSFNWIFSL